RAPERYYCVWQGMTVSGLGNVGSPHFSWPTWEITCKYPEALLRARTMSGSDRDVETDRAIMQTVVDRIGKYGLPYFPPGSVDIPPNTVCPWVSGRIILD